MLVHTCSHTLFVRACVCAQDADFTVLPFLQPLSTTIYVYPSAWKTRIVMCHTCRWECDSCSKAWALRRFILLLSWCRLFYIHVPCQKWWNKKCELNISGFGSTDIVWLDVGNYVKSSKIMSIPLDIICIMLSNNFRSCMSFHSAFINYIFTTSAVEYKIFFKIIL